MLNLLTQDLITSESPDGSVFRTSLPGIYREIMAGNVQTFPKLRHHQTHAWHALLVQLAVAALTAGRGATTTLQPPPEYPQDEQEWAARLRALAPGWPGDEPWHLITPEPDRPAFLQPPVNDPVRARDYKTTLTSPEEIDVLIASKNHHPKQRTAQDAAPEDWLFALVTLQTMQGYSGAGNYGIARMNAGLSSRPAFSLAPSPPSQGGHIRRDISVLLEHYGEFAAKYGRENLSGNPLLWLLPWDGRKDEPLPPERLHPLFIEVCRRIRLRAAGPERLEAVRAPSKSPRIDNTEMKGRTGDPWTPADLSRDGLPLTLGPGGFTCQRIVEYLTSPDWEKPFLLLPSKRELESGANLILTARGTVRGQGKTEGHYEKNIPIRSKAAAAIGAGDPGLFGKISQERIEEAATAQRILSHALHTFLSGDGMESQTQDHRNKVQPWLNRLERVIEQSFFHRLQEEFEALEPDRPERRRAWLQEDVIANARRLLRQATEQLPSPGLQRDERAVAAESLFEGRLRGEKGVPQAFSQDRQRTTPEDQTPGRPAPAAPANPNPPTPAPAEYRRNDWGDLAARYCYRLLQPDITLGRIAQLRRMDPGRPPPDIFWELLAENNLLNRSPEAEDKWIIVLQGIALTTGKNPDTGRSEPAHNGNTPPGKALYLSGISRNGLNQILNAQDETLHSLLSHALRRAARKGVKLNWRLLARLIFSQGYDEAEAAGHRRNITRDYHRAKRIESGA